MNGLLASQVFFIISSVGFVVLWIFVAVVLFYLIRITRTFSDIMDTIDEHITKIGDTTKEMLEDLRDNKIFGFFLRKKRKNRKE